MWLNKKGIAHLLSIPMLEAAGYIVSSHKYGNWMVTSPKGMKIIFTQDTRVCNRRCHILT